jgi:hypothetical protein
MIRQKYARQGRLSQIATRTTHPRQLTCQKIIGQGKTSQIAMCLSL